MAIQTQLVGKFGGGVPETAETRVTGDGMYSPPKGWKKAMGAFYGQCTSTENPTIFGQNIVRPYNGFVSGGGSPYTRNASASPERLRGCAWSNPLGGGLGGHHHTTHRETGWWAGVEKAWEYCVFDEA